MILLRKILQINTFPVLSRVIFKFLKERLLIRGITPIGGGWHLPNNLVGYADLPISG